MKYLKHFIGIVVLFIAILAAPAILEKINQPAPPAAPPQPVIETEKPPVVEEPPAQHLSGSTGINRKLAVQEPPQPVVPPPPKAINVEGTANGDSIIISGGASVRDNVVTGTLRGGRGGDSLMIDGPGWASVDSNHINGIEIFKLKNSQPNLLYFYAAGLATLDGAAAVVEGDAEIDTVWLDRALQWKDPVADGDYQRYDGTGADGVSASVSVTKGVTVDYKDR